MLSPSPSSTSSLIVPRHEHELIPNPLGTFRALGSLILSAHQGSKKGTLSVVLGSAWLGSCSLLRHTPESSTRWSSPWALPPTQEAHMQR